MVRENSHNLDKNDPNDKMNEFIDGFIFNRNNHIKNWMI